MNLDSNLPVFTNANALFCDIFSIKKIKPDQSIPL